ncbi:4Fe-4S binding protein [Methanococcus voltae]|uniref:NIL domain protein n=1 Tax=Methanococcus voltae (strain ATCC BAA-1334 / A3) TaxID=456320 RepID=D7DU79_METV3|nr:NAD-dependent dihydropyrimidine dehydrogenase PreA subunit [Methanococcus voltae]
MKKRIFYWISGRNVKKPIVSDIIKSYDVDVSILKAKMEPSEGFLTLELNGNDDSVLKSVDYLKEYGEVEDISQPIQKKEEKCIDCGACIVHCPVGAIKFEEDFSVAFDIDECIGCKTCAKICPTKAIIVHDL